MQIRKATNEDVKNISMLHKKVFDSSYFSVHYPDKILDKYFSRLLNSNDYCYVVADGDQNIFGFLIGGYKTQKAVDDFMRENITAIVICMIKNPIFILKGINKFINRLFLKSSESKTKLRLFLIGVDPTTAKKGIGTLLLSEFETAILKDGINLFGLYVRNDNIDAIEFYKRKGFQLEYERSDLSCYIKNI